MSTRLIPLTEMHELFHGPCANCGGAMDEKRCIECGWTLESEVDTSGSEPNATQGSVTDIDQATTSADPPAPNGGRASSNAPKRDLEITDPSDSVQLNPNLEDDPDPSGMGGDPDGMGAPCMCPACNCECPPGSNFCNACGTAITMDPGMGGDPSASGGAPGGMSGRMGSPTPEDAASTDGSEANATQGGVDAIDQATTSPDGTSEARFMISQVMQGKSPTKVLESLLGEITPVTPNTRGAGPVGSGKSIVRRGPRNTRMY